METQSIVDEERIVDRWQQHFQELTEDDLGKEEEHEKENELQEIGTTQ